MEYENKFVGLSSVTSHDLEILRYELEYGWKLALMPNDEDGKAQRRMRRKNQLRKRKGRLLVLSILITSLYLQGMGVFQLLVE